MTLRASARAAGYRLAYRLPRRVRWRLVRLAMPKFIVGAVVLLRESGTEAPSTSEGAGAQAGGRLMLQRQPPGHGWSLPGGLMERGERPIAAAARELFEEAGVRVDPDDLTPMTPNAVIHPYGRWVDCVFTASVPTETPFRVAGGEVLEAAWFRLDALPPLTVPTARLLAHYGIGPYAEYPEVREV